MDECWGASWLRLLAANMVTERRFVAPGNALQHLLKEIDCGSVFEGDKMILWGSLRRPFRGSR